jgi:predicted enzyme related to lactoylglutathione lyase
MIEKNTFCWIDIPVLDLDRAIAFYTAILQEPVQKIDEHGFQFGLLHHTENNVSGCLTIMDDRKPSQNGPLVYLNVEGHLKNSVTAVEQSKGKVLAPIQEIGPYGYRAIVLDTEGNAIALYSKSND